MRSNGLLKKAKYCDNCKILCFQVRQSEKVDQCVFRCSKGRTKYSIRQDSFFSCSHLPLKTILTVMYLFMMKVPMKTMMKMLLGISSKTMVDWFNLCRDICSWRILEDIYKLGEDEDDIVEIHESKFGRKRKYAKESTRNQEGTWVFGMIGRKRQRVFIFAVEDRKRETLQPYMQAHIKSGATVHSDELSTYFNLKDIGYNHKTVNHSEEFVSAEGIHTYTIEGFWGNGKHHFKQIREVNRNLLGPHLDEIMYRGNYKNTDIVRKFFHDVTAKFNVNHDLPKDATNQYKSI
ncbi:unnamed protein product [Mytilus coruscus]|uniref:ISXO2-like transposase domain-containing protein n=1 Tax=Mytilus coruscus TaxID=42192 RepID=A0A6J8BSK8_MYTCO|nr:unnamed protein product [Mytilus coruscus]